MNQLCRFKAAYEEVEKLLQSIDILTNKKLYSFTITDVFHYKTSILKTILNRAVLYRSNNECKLTKEQKRDLSPMKVEIKTAGYDINNVQFTIAKYLSMNPEHRCFCDSGSAKTVLYNRENGQYFEDLNYVDNIIIKLTTGIKTDDGIIYEKKWEETDIYDIIMYDSFFSSFLCVMWDYDITFFFDTFFSSKKIDIEKFCYHSLTKKLYYIKTTHDIFLIENLYDFEDIVISINDDEEMQRDFINYQNTKRRKLDDTEHESVQNAKEWVHTDQDKGIVALHNQLSIINYQMSECNDSQEKKKLETTFADVQQELVYNENM